MLHFPLKFFVRNIFVVIYMWQNSVDLLVDKHIITLSVNVRLLLTDFDRNGNVQTKLSNIRLHQIYVGRSEVVP